MTRGRLSFIPCKSGRYFTEEIVKFLQDICPSDDIRMIKCKDEKFANGEVKVVLNECIRGDDVYVVQCLHDLDSGRSVNDLLMSLVTAIDAARRSDAARITAIAVPYPYARQEKQKAREAITAAIVSKLLEDVGADNVMTLDIHAPAIAGNFQKAIFFNLHAVYAITDYFVKEHKDITDNLIVVSPDIGGTARIDVYAKVLKTNMAIISKERDYKKVNEIKSMMLIGDVKDKDCLLVDDMVDTAGTIVGAVELLKNSGARNIYVACSLPLLSGPAIERLDDLYQKGLLKMLVGTDVIPRGSEFKLEHPWYKTVNMAPFFAKVIRGINNDESVGMYLV